MVKVLITGAAGFIGSHLAQYLKENGFWVRAVDIKAPQFGQVWCDEHSWMCDLRVRDNAMRAMEGIDWAFALAADMGGMGYIGHAHADIILNNTAINVNSVYAACKQKIKRYLFSSSACIYPEYLQKEAKVEPLAEWQAYPAEPQDAYGWEKLHAEHLCKYVHGAGLLNTRIVRFHNVYGPRGSWNDGREKAPAALCRKVALTKLTGDPTVEIWGDGEQTRSFMYIDDCIDGLLRLMQSNYTEPLNLGRDRMVTINKLADIIADIAGVEIVKKHIEGPQGVRGRNSNNARCRQVLGWEPKTRLEDGLKPTYGWIEEQVKQWRASSS